MSAESGTNPLEILERVAYGTLCLSRIATSFWVSSWESLSLMMTGVSRLSSRKTYLRPEGRGLSLIEGSDGTSV